MTIIVGITTPDGVILGSDSRATQTRQAGYRIVSDSAHKVFEIERFGVATAGHALIDDDTIAGLMDQFLAQLDDDDAADINVFAKALAAFFDFRFQGWLGDVAWNVHERGWALYFLVAGYDDEGIGHIREVRIPGPEIVDTNFTTTSHGTIWRGQTDVISRLLQGVDWSALGEVGGEEISRRLHALGYNILSPVTVQDGVDYASFLIRTTIDMQRFSDGTIAAPGLIPACGGALQILVVERGGTRWATKPELRVT